MVERCHLLHGMYKEVVMSVYNMSGVYDLANSNVYGSSFSGTSRTGSIDAIITARDGQIEEAKRRAQEKIGPLPESPGGPVSASAGGASKYIMIAGGLFLAWFLFLRKKGLTGRTKNPIGYYTDRFGRVRRKYRKYRSKTRHYLRKKKARKAVSTTLPVYLLNRGR